MLLYIHGFNSSPDSEKGRVTADYVRRCHPQVNLVQPQLPCDTRAAMALLGELCEQALAKGETLSFIGSSLGGFYASFLVQRYGGKAVLINPAVAPYHLFDEFLGPQHNPYTGEDYQVLPEHKDALLDFDLPAIANPERFFVLLQTGDEVLDYRDALTKYHCCEMLLQPGGDHSFIGYGAQLPAIGRFLQLP
ncbi:YqiA/YcfP family alpha/beta fold hydrolase [Shewanella sedimentimangrovi]|uniref:Esterase YqiA n=1 Tax=Shewanella sedimentimangrovi TaxID=2814293 RepID=A0ABX7R0Q7_9GAMM|nr:YqiA/YcfP family alpha/beta fold hydrolase [Shewanella sedimentimangrovi]QSX36660.1 esterase YqiA [Shewanella sedimentimangrovi]